MISKNVYNFCKDDISLIENYDKAINDKTQIWHCHHRLESKLNYSKTDLINNNIYYHRPASELIFLTQSEHVKLHHKDKKLSIETKQKLSKPKSNETKKNMSIARKGKLPFNTGKHRVYDEDGRFHYE